ncbi:DeoR family transcriptional regulator [Citrobacter freundii]|nr:DeoR family transcriptional regulator [Citrobacter freundii]
MPGGTLRAHNGGIVGPGAVNFIEGFRADYLITSIGAIEEDGTLLEFDVNEALVAKTMIKHARNTLLVADHTKFTASAAVSIGNMRKIRAFFTDSQPPNSFKQLLDLENIELVIAEKETT